MTSVTDLRSKLDLVGEHYETLKDFFAIKGKKKYKSTIRSLLDDIDILEREIIDGVEHQMQYALSLLNDPVVDYISRTMLTDMISELFQISIELNEMLKELNEGIFRLKY